MIDEVLALLRSSPRHWWPTAEVEKAMKSDACGTYLHRIWEVWGTIERRRSPATNYVSWEWRWKGRKK